MRRLRLLPLPFVLFPGAEMPLHIFEPRYRQMMAHCLEGDRLFGMVYHDPDRSGPFEFAEQVGCVAELARFQPIPDGRSLVLAQGIKRFQLLGEADSSAMYYEGTVEDYADLEEAADEIRPRREASIDLFEHLLSRTEDAPAEWPKIEPERETSYQLARWIRAEVAWQQQLLELRTERERLDRIDSLLRSVLRQMQ